MTPLGTFRYYKVRPEAKAPWRAYEGDAGWDVTACIEKALTLRPGERGAFPTGLLIEIPVGWELQIRPRSGLALRHGISITNTPATIDAGYRDELRVQLINHGTSDFYVEPGMRIAQIVPKQVPTVDFQEMSAADLAALPGSDRGNKGFGSTGTT